jgi:hypothetical protein
MASENWRDALPKKVLVLKILVGALFSGCLVMLAVMLGVSASFDPSPDLEILVYVGLAVAAAALFARAVVPALLLAAGRRSILAKLRKEAENRSEGTRSPDFDALENEAANHLAAMLHGKTLVGAAILEGAAMLSILLYLFVRSPISLAAAVVLAFSILLSFPTFGRVSAWIEDQMQLLKDEL